MFRRKALGYALLGVLTLAILSVVYVFQKSNADIGKLEFLDFENTYGERKALFIYHAPQRWKDWQEESLLRYKWVNGEGKEILSPPIPARGPVTDERFAVKPPTNAVWQLQIDVFAAGGRFDLMLKLKNVWREKSFKAWQYRSIVYGASLVSRLITNNPTASDQHQQ